MHVAGENSQSINIEKDAEEEEEADEHDVWWEAYINKGDLSNVLTFFSMVLGFILLKTAPGPAADYIFAFGLFGFAGGVTNWLAVKMLFDEVPGLIGSGVIPKRFEEIRAAVKKTIMKTFFDKKFIAKYVTESSQDIMAKLGLKEKMTEFLMSDKGDAMLSEKLANMRSSDLGLMLAMVNIDIGGAMMIARVRDELINAAGEAGPLIASVVDPKNLPIDSLRQEVDKLMEAKLGELDADKVTDTA